MDSTLVVMAMLTLVVGYLVMSSWVHHYRKARKACKATILREISALAFSRDHKDILPLLRGMVDEEHLISLSFRRVGFNIWVRLRLIWWGQTPWNRRRVRQKATVLLKRGGAYNLEWKGLEVTGMVPYRSKGGKT